MTMLINNNHHASSSNYYRKTSSESTRQSNTLASAYVVNISTMALTGLHYSTGNGAGGAGWARKRSGDAAYHITEECERLFCETLKAVFLVEKDAGLENLLVVDTRNTTARNAVQIPPRQPQHTILEHNLPTPSPSPDGRIYPQTAGLIKDYVEVWDYAGGARFRGFVAEKEQERSLFIFFDKEVIGNDLKPGLVALLELAEADGVECSKLVICVDRTASKDDIDEVTRNLGWVGFELMMLDSWAGESGCISDRWLFLGMEV